MYVNPRHRCIGRTQHMCDALLLVHRSPTQGVVSQAKFFFPQNAHFIHCSGAVWLSAAHSPWETDFCATVQSATCVLQTQALRQKVSMHVLQIFWANTISYRCICRLRTSRCAKRPLDTQITGLAHHCSCRSSSPASTSEILEPVSSFFLLLTPFSRPDSFCPVLSGHGGKFLLYFKAIRHHD